MPYLIAIGLIAAVLVFIVEYWYIALIVVVIVVAAAVLPGIIRDVRKNKYFASEEFQQKKSEIASFVAEHNEIAAYTSEIRSRGTFALGISSTGSQSHLAAFENTSTHNYRRDRNVAQYKASNVHNCSLQVVRSAKADPIKYLMKYFNIKAEEPRLAEVEALGSEIAQLENAVINLKQREKSITKSFVPPAFILEYYAEEFMQHAGVKLSPISVPYPIYKFEYVSAGGNSSQQTTIKLDTRTIDALSERLSEKIKFKRSAAGQRALMTARLRNFIKDRDNHTCQSCSISLTKEPHLLLEVDHIVPVSKGGLSTIENLQTLCWKCNRTKSNKMVVR